MPADPISEQKDRITSGVLSAVMAFLIWGLSPVYWKALIGIPALEIIIHRIVWSFLFGIILVILSGRWAEFMAVFRDRRTLAVLFGTSLLMTINWLVYVWAVNNDRMLQASLGYYITPLVNVSLGMIFLKERLRPLQKTAVIIAACAVLYLTFYYGVFPWVSIVLALCFGFYGLLRKVAVAGSLIGLTMETLLMCLPALIYLAFLERAGHNSFLHQGFKIDLLLIGTGIITGLPLLLFTMGARRITLASLGFIQYIGPTCIFLLGVVVYDEPFLYAQMITFAMIWTALAIYSTDTVRTYRREQSQGPS